MLVQPSNHLMEKLDALLEDIRAIQSKLILIVAPPGSGKTNLLRALAERRGADVMNVGAELGTRLAALPARQRGFEATELLRDLAHVHAFGDVLLLDNIELLFDQTLQLQPLDLLKRHAHVRRVVAVWPGDLRHGRLTYAELGHPEHKDYSLDGVVIFEMETKA